MASGSQKFIARNRAPRVQIEYDVELYGAEKKVQLPFVMGVMSDLAGKSARPQPSIEERKFLEIDVDSFDDRMRAIAPRVSFAVPNTLSGEGSLAVDLTFESMADFSPGAIAARIEPLRALLDARTQLSNLLTYMDGKAGAEALIERVLGDRNLLAALVAAPAPEDASHSVRFGFGAGVDRRHQAPFEARFGFPLLEAWAMTETGGGAAVIASEAPRHVGTSCFGRAGPALEIRLVDETGADVAVDVPGELLVRAAGADPRRGFFREYLKDAAATADAWAGGWFHTGDVVRRDADGYLYFVDRRKNVIRRSGENIAAVEVESVLRRHPMVREVAVAATPDPMRGDEVLACIVPAEPLDAARQADVARSVVALCLEQLAYFKAPGWVAFVDGLPLTPTQKIQRGELKALAARLPESGACIDTRALKRRPKEAEPPAPGRQ